MSWKGVSVSRTWPPSCPSKHLSNLSKYLEKTFCVRQRALIHWFLFSFHLFFLAHTSLHVCIKLWVGFYFTTGIFCQFISCFQCIGQKLFCWTGEFGLIYPQPRRGKVPVGKRTLKLPSVYLCSSWRDVISCWRVYLYMFHQQEMRLKKTFPVLAF